MKKKDILINYRELKDQQLTQKVLLNKDDKAFEELWTRYYQPVKSFLRMMLKNKSSFAEDIASDTFIKVFAKLEKYDPRYAFSGWIYRIATNSAIDFLRVYNRMKIDSIDAEKSTKAGEHYAVQLPDIGLTPDEIFILQQREDFLTEMLGALDTPYRDLIIGKFIEQKTYKELSEELQIPVSTLKSRIRRILRKLRKLNEFRIRIFKY